MSGQPRTNNFNLLRLVFALMVMLSHATQLASGDKAAELLYAPFHAVTLGDLAVDGFFLLSGYLILQSWLNKPRATAFLKSRVLRIYPGFIVATLICVFVVGPLGAADVTRYFSELSLPNVLRTIVRLLQPEAPPVFDGQAFPHLNEAMWTVSYEFKCYLGVLVLGLLGLARRRLVWIGLLVLMLFVVAWLRFGISLPVSQAVYDAVNGRASTFRFASFFLAGGCFYLFREKVRYDGRLVLAVSAILLATLFAKQGPLLEMLLPLLGGYLVFYAGFKYNATLARFNRLPDISYGTYLYGWPIQKLLLWYFPEMSAWLLFPLSCLGAMACGLVSWHLIEAPCLRLKKVAWIGQGLGRRDVLPVGLGVVIHPPSSTFSRRLREARLRAGLEQGRLGVLAGLEESSSSEQVNRYESGIEEPSLPLVEALAKVLGLPPTYFFCEDDHLAEIIRQHPDATQLYEDELDRLKRQAIIKG